MKLIFISILCMVSAQDYMEPNIHNGQPANIEDFPFQVLIYNTAFYFGESLISDRFVISCTHNFFNFPPENISVYLGSVHQKEGIERSGRDLIVHSDFNKEKIRNDIALLRIDSVTYSSNINAIPLPEISDNYNYEAEFVIISGWGKTDINGNLSEILLYAGLYVISNADCASIFHRWPIEDTKICTMGLNEEAACISDTGGPLVHEDSGVLIGISSFRQEEVGCSGATAFTRVTKYRQWIQDNAGI